MIRLRAQNHRFFFRYRGSHLKIERTLDRKEAYLFIGRLPKPLCQPRH